MIIVSDASSLILLEKIKLLIKLIENKVNLIMPAEVYKEAVEKGKERKYADAFTIEEKINKELLKVKKIKNQMAVNKIMMDFGIEKGEAESIVLFKEIEADILATDDGLAINACKALEIPTSGCPAFVTESYHKKIINKQEALDMIKILGKVGRYSNDIIFQTIRNVEVKI